MTFAEWRMKYPAAVVSQVYPDKAPAVYFVQAYDPICPSNAYTPSVHCDELRTLSDYRITSTNTHRGSIWVAPVLPDAADRKWTRAEYMTNQCTHEEYYLSVARSLGYNAVRAIVLRLIAPVPRLTCGNELPVSIWDRCDPEIRSLVRHEHMAQTWDGTIAPRMVCWSLSESVCVAKAVARHVIATERAGAAVVLP